MHRSGSSLLAKSLECCDVGLGNNLMAKQPDNPKGFFEDPRISELNERILTIMDYQWSLLSTSVMTVPCKGQLEGIKKEAKDLLLNKIEECRKNHYLGIKDPRLCRLAYFWFSICNECSIAYKVIFLVRNPNEVALSLNKRNNMPQSGGYALWLDYLYSAIGQLNNVDTLFIRLDAFCCSMNEHINAIGDFLGKEVNKEALSKYTTEFYDRKLLHTARRSHIVNSSAWDYLQSCQSGVRLSNDLINELKKICKAEQNTDVALKAYIDQLNWHRVAESQALRKIISDQAGTLNAIEKILSKALDAEIGAVSNLKNALDYVRSNKDFHDN